MSQCMLMGSVWAQREKAAGCKATCTSWPGTPTWCISSTNKNWSVSSAYRNYTGFSPLNWGKSLVLVDVSMKYLILLKFWILIGGGHSWKCSKMIPNWCMGTTPNNARVQTHTHTHSIYPHSLRYLPGPDPKVFITSFGSRERLWEGGTQLLVLRVYFLFCAYGRPWVVLKTKLELSVYKVSDLTSYYLN